MAQPGGARREPRRPWPALAAVGLVVAVPVLLGLNQDRTAELFHRLLPWPPVVVGVLTALPAALVLAGTAAALGSGRRRWSLLVVTVPFAPLLLLGMPGRRSGASDDHRRELEVVTTRGWADAVMDGALAGFGTLVVVAAVMYVGTRTQRLPVRPVCAALVAAATIAMVLTHRS
ncbi:hypothetical protein [Aeromicrobium sp. IC_218]|uniref:hypothetical protein n=1 Tax=Aeromicrobium sp. IC_218 TaxID=2545468 RepID=UPI00103E3440|nr:hypothetical protein [Aeromicrobium sp. IC_218]TCJ00648.1 hypothetical protein E0W78_00725 [Aeromicrobium sp. IC_218]